MQIIFLTFINTMSSLFNVGGLMFLIIYIYAVLGINLFAEVKFKEPMHKRLNFMNISNAYTTLFAAATGEGWNNLMEALGQRNTGSWNCINNPTYEDFVAAGYKPVGCGNRFTVVVYFFSFVVLVSLVFVNLFVAIILNGYYETKDSERDVKLDENLLGEF